MKIKLIGDIHLGKNFPYTTSRTREVFKELLLDTVQQVEAHIQLGDLFDGFSVSSEALVNGVILSKGMTVISGNHDKSNNTDKSSALQLCGKHLGTKVVWDKPESSIIGATTFTLVPHQLTQEAFESAVLGLASPGTKHKVLCLHCNFGNREGTETENYLRPEVAKQLLEKFDLVVSGHEHNFNTPMKGVVMLGSVLPFNFGEMATKKVMVFDTLTGAYTFETTWEASNYQKLELGQPYSGAQFVEFVGQVTAEEAAAVNRQVAELYKTATVIAVKNNTQLIRHTKAVEAEAVEDWVEVVKRQCNERQQQLLTELLG